MDNKSGMYHLYILKCSDHTLYAGITTDVQRRIREHNDGKSGARYTRGRRPVELAYSKKFNSRSAALKEECRIKKLTRKEKLEIINHTTNE